MKQKQIRVQVESIEKYREVITYFSTYSLMSYKYFNYMKVLEVHNMMLNKEHLSDIGRSEILAIKEKSHNNSEWTHLNKKMPKGLLSAGDGLRDCTITYY